MKEFFLLLFLLFIAFVFVSILYFIFGRVVEPVYMLVFKKPVYVHFYPFPKTLCLSHKELLEKEFSFYRKLSPVRQAYFRHRVHRFMASYKFVGKEELTVTEEMKLRIAATAVMLTFGLRRYIISTFEAIVIYPDIYQSGNGNYHKGEFNPRSGAVVFSWHHFMEGMEFGSDNLNLGLHEFTHAMHFDCTMRPRLGSSAMMYLSMFDKILNYITNEQTRQKVIQANYFREYAYTNQHEFIAVALEYFFETPDEFQRRLPELYDMVKKMINFRG